MPINRARLLEIQQAYLEENGGPFLPNELPWFHSAQSHDPSARFEPLVKAINKWVFRRELSSAQLSQFDDFFNGKAVAPDVRLRGEQARKALPAFGYDDDSFRDVLAFVIQVENEKSLQPKP
jgi:hypothetical protein